MAVRGITLTSRLWNICFPDDTRLDDSEDLVDSLETHRSLAQAMHDPQQSNDWDKFLQWAECRGRQGTDMANEEEDLADRAPKEGEYLWEIGCKVCWFCLANILSSLNSPRSVLKIWQHSRQCVKWHIQQIHIFKPSLSSPIRPFPVIFLWKCPPLPKQGI